MVMMGENIPLSRIFDKYRKNITKTTLKSRKLLGNYEKEDPKLHLIQQQLLSVLEPKHCANYSP